MGLKPIRYIRGLTKPVARTGNHLVDGGDAIGQKGCGDDECADHEDSQSFAVHVYNMAGDKLGSVDHFMIDKVIGRANWLQ